MLLGFISLLLTVFQDYIAGICISQKVAASWHPCPVQSSYETQTDSDSDTNNSRKLLDRSPRRVLATKGYDKCTEKVYIVGHCNFLQKSSSVSLL